MKIEDDPDCANESGQRTPETGCLLPVGRCRVRHGETPPNGMGIERETNGGTHCPGAVTRGDGGRASHGGSQPGGRPAIQRERQRRRRAGSLSRARIAGDRPGRPHRGIDVAERHADHRLHPAGAGRRGNALARDRDPGGLRRGQPVHRRDLLRRPRRDPRLPAAARRQPGNRRPLHVDPRHLQRRSHGILLRDQPRGTDGRRAPFRRRRRPAEAREEEEASGAARRGTGSGRPERPAGPTAGPRRSASPSGPSTSTRIWTAGGSTSSARSAATTRRYCGAGTAATKGSGGRSTRASSRD